MVARLALANPSDVHERACLQREDPLPYRAALGDASCLFEHGQRTEVGFRRLSESDGEDGESAEQPSRT